jgi:predicted DNA-binding transcriptional regulator AlpA
MMARIDQAGGDAAVAPVAAGIALISMPEVAELAGVQRPAVTTWRRRHDDFPRPVRTPGAGSGLEMFDAEAVSS